MRHPHGLRAAGAAGGEVGWNLASATFNGTPLNFFSILSQETNVTGIAFKTDGTKMYIIGNTNNSVYAYDLSTAWDVATAVLLNSFSVGAQDGQPRELFFKSDGTKMYFLGVTNDSVYEYTLSTAWDVSTASYIQSFSIAAKETNAAGLSFKDDGTKMYITGVASGNVHEYTLSTGWNISTAAFSQTYSTATQTTTLRAVTFKDDGTKMYVMGSTQVFSYNLSTAWDISTSTVSTSSNIPSITQGCYAIAFKTDGTKFFLVDPNRDSVIQLSVSTAWDISTGSFIYPSTDYFSFAAEETFPVGVAFKPDGTKMYILGSTGDDVNEYTLSTAWNITTASYLQTFSVITEDTAPSAVTFKPDGTKMYVLGDSGNDVNEYNLSTAWNVSTASYVQIFSVATQDTNPSGIVFKDDGSQMYVIGSSSDSVHQYALSTAWDISTASFSSSFSVASKELSPSGLAFKSDGSKMFAIGSTYDSVHEYLLSTPWSVSTASFTRSLNIAAFETSLTDIAFNDDGTKMFIVGSVMDAVWSFDL